MKRTLSVFTAICILLTAILSTSLSLVAFSADNAINFKNAKTIESDIKYEATVESGDYILAKFTAPEDGFYLFEALGSIIGSETLYEPVATLYDGKYNELQYVESDHYYPDVSKQLPYAKIVEKLKKGETYYYKTNLLNPEISGSYLIRVIKAPDLVFTYSAQQDDIGGSCSLYRYTGTWKEFSINTRYTVSQDESLYYKPMKNVILEGIGLSAFEGNEYLKTINLPYDLYYIASEAFLNCKKLSTVNLGRNTQTIGYRAFAGCDSLKSITIESSHVLLEPQCFGFDEDGNKHEDFTIYCYKGSTAEKYAKENGINYSIISTEPIPTDNTKTSEPDDPEPTSEVPNTSITPSSSNPVVIPRVKQATIKKIKKTAIKKQLKVKWKKISKVSGFQIKCGLNKKMTKGKKVVFARANKRLKIIKGLKSGRRYFVKVRAYKTYISESGEVIRAYGKWSKVEKARVR